MKKNIINFLKSILTLDEYYNFLDNSSYGKIQELVESEIDEDFYDMNFEWVINNEGILSIKGKEE